MNSTVLIVGLGGVGSWIAEALCRSGIGNFIFVGETCVLHDCESRTYKTRHG